MNYLDYVFPSIIFISYLSIFLIQKSQLSKQKSVLDQYEKIYKIINIDEIEKYVKLNQKKNRTHITK